jgi:hypothetical protein
MPLSKKEHARRITAIAHRQMLFPCCGWCGRPLINTSRGRLPKWCSKAHKDRAWRKQQRSRHIFVSHFVAANDAARRTLKTLAGN